MGGWEEWEVGKDRRLGKLGGWEEWEVGKNGRLGRKDGRQYTILI